MLLFFGILIVFKSNYSSDAKFTFIEVFLGLRLNLISFLSK
jgi:hypothetical protein